MTKTSYPSRRLFHLDPVPFFSFDLNHDDDQHTQIYETNTVYRAMRARNNRVASDQTSALTSDATRTGDGHRRSKASPNTSTSLTGDVLTLARKQTSMAKTRTQQSMVSPAATDKGPIEESTPLAARSHQLVEPASPKPVHVVPSSNRRQLFSPLPPSSPPLLSSDGLEYDDENVPPAPRKLASAFAPQSQSTDEDENKENLFDEQGEDEDKENEFVEDKENLARQPLPKVEQEEAIHAKKEATSEDDPFGFKALERRLKTQRETRRRGSFAPGPAVPPPRKGKEPAHSRAPLGELPFEPLASTSVIKQRAPTPYHESDDLEDMYLDPSTLPPRNLGAALAAAAEDDDDDDNNEDPNMSPPTGLEVLEEEMNEEEEGEIERAQVRQSMYAKGKARAVQRSSSVSEVIDVIDAVRTPRPHHIANIYPLRSPFSSREGTPCDRSLPDSAPSSPSPMKPMTVLHSLPVGTSTRKANERLRNIFKSSAPTPQSALKNKTRAKPPADAPPAKRRRVTIGKENDVDDDESVEDPMVATDKLKNLLPKRPSRRPTRQSSATPAPVTNTRTTRASTRAQTKARGPGRPLSQGKILVADSLAGGSSQADPSSPVSSPVSRTKRRRAPTQTAYEPVKRAKTQPAAVSREPASRKNAKPPSGAGAGKRTTRAKAPAKASTAAKGKGKGRARAGAATLEGEDSVSS